MIITFNAKSSSNIESVDYSNYCQVLTVRFHSGLVYQYSDVPQELINEWVKAESIGSFFHKNIRTSFKYVKIDMSKTEVEVA